MSIDNYCDHITGILAANGPLDRDAERHLDHCSSCADIARIPALLESGAHARPAVEPSAGFHARTVARSRARLVQRRRARVARNGALAACTALLLVTGATYGPGLLEDAETVSAIRPDMPEPTDDERDPVIEADDQLAPLELDRLAVLSEVDRSLAFRADWRAAGGHVSAEDIARARDELKLTGDQEKALRRIVAEEKKQEIQLRARIEEARVDLGTQLDSDRPDEKAVSRAIERISELEARVRKVRVLSWLDARKVLNQEQRRKLSRGAERKRLRRLEERAQERAQERERRIEREYEREGREPFEPVPPVPRLDDLDIDIDTDGFENFDVRISGMDERLEEMERALERMDVDGMVSRGMKDAQHSLDQLAPELEHRIEEALEQADLALDKNPNLSPEELERAREEIRRAREQMHREMERARRELKSARPDMERIRREAERDLERAREDLRKAREQNRRRGREGRGADRERAQRDAERAHERAQREAERAHERAQREAERARERAQREAERARRDEERARRDEERARRNKQPHDR